MTHQKDVLFKYVNVRAPIQQHTPRKEKLYVSLSQTAFEKSLLSAPSNKQRRKIAAEYIENDTNYVGQSDEVVQLIELAKQASTKADVKQAIHWIENKLDVKFHEDLKNGRLNYIKRSLSDSYYAQAFVPQLKPTHRLLIVNGLQACAFLDELASAETVPEFREQLPTIDAQVLKKTMSETRSTHKNKYDLQDISQKIQVLSERMTQYNTVLGEIELGERTMKNENSFGSTIENEVIEPFQSVDVDSNTQTKKTTVWIRPEKNWIFGKTTQPLMSDESRTFLQAVLGKAEYVQPLELKRQLQDSMQKEIETFMRSNISSEMLKQLLYNEQFGKLLYKANYTLQLDSNITTKSQLENIDIPDTPVQRGIRSLGVGDLYIVRQQLKRYEMGEISHIENVLASEKKERIHKRLREIESVLIIETEQLEEEERSLQTTERFEMRKEIQKTIQSDMAVNAGVDVSSSFGPVKVSTSMDFAYSSSSEQATQTANIYARDTIDDVVSRLHERTREERTRRTLERFEETNTHGFDNQGSDSKNITGIYRWVDKYYEVQLVKYGKRLMMEFIVPEPAVLYKQFKMSREQDLDIKKPEPPTYYRYFVNGRLSTPQKLKPEDLNGINYLSIGAKYDADVEPPPAQEIKISHSFSDVIPKDSAKYYAKSFSEVNVPDGYEASSADCTFTHWGESSNEFRIYLGGNTINPDSDKNVDMKFIRGPIAVDVLSQNIYSYAIQIVINCTRTEESYKRWQQTTYQAIIKAYQQKVALYHDAVAQAEMRGETIISSHSPETNRKIERDELKRACIHILTDDFAEVGLMNETHEDVRFNAIEASSALEYDLPNPQRSLFEGKIIQWFEQAFDWRNMTYRLYPYMWGRRETWKAHMQHLNDADPKFSDFLRAGAARVIVPARKEYTQAVLYYLYTNILWHGNDVPELSGDLYVDVTQEIAEDAYKDLQDLQACSIDSGYPCEVDRWEVKVPTTLIYLQEDHNLPDETTT